MQISFIIVSESTFLNAHTRIETRFSVGQSFFHSHSNFLTVSEGIMMFHDVSTWTFKRFIVYYRCLNKKIEQIQFPRIHTEKRSRTYRRSLFLFRFYGITPNVDCFISYATIEITFATSKTSLRHDAKQEWSLEKIESFINWNVRISRKFIYRLKLRIRDFIEVSEDCPQDSFICMYACDSRCQVRG